MKKETKLKLINYTLVSLPVILITIGAVYAPDLNAKILTCWGFIIGTSFGALISSFNKR